MLAVNNTDKTHRGTLLISSSRTSTCRHGLKFLADPSSAGLSSKWRPGWCGLAPALREPRTHVEGASSPSRRSAGVTSEG
jgi:hypothetical protein